MSITDRFFIVFATASLVLIARPAFAQRPDAVIVNKPVPISTEVVIPGTPTIAGGIEGQIADLAQYIGIVYNFLISIAGLVASIMMVIGGFQYLTSAGDSGKIGAAKKRMMNALIGLVLALGSYTILKTINPATLILKVPGGIKGVETVADFLPFCDKLALQYKIPEDQIVRTGKLEAITQGMGCGQAGFIRSQVNNADGTTSESRVWCVWRGNKAVAAQKQQAGEYVSDYGCADDTSIGGAKVIGTLNIHALSICMPRSGITQEQLNEDYDQDKIVDTKLGACVSCNELGGTVDKVSLLGLPKGDLSCQYWQNTANNGDPKDYDFKFSKKKIMQDTRLAGWMEQDDRSRRMYYCGYSANHERCIYVPILCHRVSECDSYDDMVMNYCEKADAGSITCHASETLGSQWARQAGNAAHLIPICEADPCEKGSDGCEVGGLAGMRNTMVGGASSNVRVAARIMTGGLTNGISCDAK